MPASAPQKIWLLQNKFKNQRARVPLAVASDRSGRRGPATQALGTPGRRRSIPEGPRPAVQQPKPSGRRDGVGPDRRARVPLAVASDSSGRRGPATQAIRTAERGRTKRYCQLSNDV